MTRRALACRSIAASPIGPETRMTKPRIVLATEARLIELDAKSGKPALDFGDNGEVNLRTGVADDYPKAHYAITSPPAIYKGLIILGPSTQEGPSKGPSGDPRAFDAQDWQTGLAIPCGAASRRARKRNLGAGRLEGSGGAQRLGCDDHRRRARPGLHAAWAIRPTASMVQIERE